MAYKKEYPRDMSFIDREGKLIKPNKKQYYSTLGKREEKQGHYLDAYKLYENAGMKDKAKEMRELYTKSKSKSIDTVVTVIMTLSGIGILYMLFSKEAVMSVRGQLLAPPFPNYLTYVLPLVIIAGGIYFLWKKAHEDLIPLSF